jgi:hypothetical protein
MASAGDAFFEGALDGEQSAPVIYQIRRRHRRSLGSGFRIPASAAWGMLLYSLG